MGNHRAPRGAGRATSHTGPTSTAPRPAGGKRRAVKHAGPRGPLFRRLPSAPVLLGVAALTVSATGAVTVGQTAVTASDHQPTSHVASAANALSGVSSVSTSTAQAQREEAVSRDSRRDALEKTSTKRLQQAAEAQAQERNAELAKLAQSAEKQAEKIALNLWQLPIDPNVYRLTATFGQSSGLWSSTHTGLDFAAPEGTPVKSVTNGTITSVEYAGAYGNQVIVTTEEGEELWYCHLSAYAVEVGDEVRSGDVIGYVGSTGNSTGPHMHLEVRPGAGDPVDPFQALVAHGITP